MIVKIILHKHKSSKDLLSFKFELDSPKKKIKELTNSVLQNSKIIFSYRTLQNGSITLLKKDL